MFRNVVFSDIGTPENGAAIFITGVNIEVICCKFIRNRVKNRGGAIYFTNGIIGVSNCIFYKCYTTTNQDNIWGNAIFISSKEANIKQTSTCLCGESATLCGDSSIFVDNCKTVLQNINATNNYGIGGGGIVAIYGCLAGTKISYLQGYECADYFEMVTSQVFTTYENINFINTSELWNVFWESSNNLIECISCLFWNINKAVLSHGGRTISLINCTSNMDTTPSATKISLFNPNPIVINNGICQMNERFSFANQNCLIFNNFSFFVQLIFIITQ
jgi:predicted outer membrane repeat protein